MKNKCSSVVQYLFITATILCCLTTARAQSTNAYLLANGTNIYPAKQLYLGNNSLVTTGYSGFGPYSTDSAYISLVKINPGFTTGTHAEYKLDNSVAWTSDMIKTGNSYVTGGISLGNLRSTAWLMKTDTNFNISWAYYFSNLSHGQTGLHNFFYEGNKFTAYSYQTQFHDGFYRISTTVNDTTFKATEITRAAGGYFIAHNAVQYGTPGQHILCGTASDVVGQDGWITKIDSAHAVWSYTYDFGGKVQEQMHGIITTADGHLLVPCVSQDDYSNVITYILKLDTAGNIAWCKKIKGPTPTTYFTAAAETDQHDYLLAGFVSYPYELVVIKLDVTGNLIWSHRFQSFSGVGILGSAFTKKPDGSFILNIAYGGQAFIELDNGGNGCNFINDTTMLDSAYSGTIRTSLPLKFTPFAITKAIQPVYTRSLTYQTSVVCSSTDIAQLPQQTALLLYPQPTHNELNITFTENPGNKFVMKVFDITGRQLLQQGVENANKITLNTSMFTKGLYIVQLISAEKNYNAKFIVD